jgi:hypothetical protein
VWPASNTPTTVQSREAKRSVSPRPAPLKSSAIERPAMISAVPGRNMRPSTRCTCGRSSSPCDVTPRITTFAGLPVLRLGSVISTTGSFDTSGRPAASSAICGSACTISACARAMPLWTSVCELRRITTTLSSRPVATSVCSSPADSMSTVAKT